MKDVDKNYMVGYKTIAAYSDSLSYKVLALQVDFMCPKTTTFIGCGFWEYLRGV